MSPLARLAVFFASYFAYVGLFAPYLSLWLNGRGFSPAEIGLLASPMQWTRVVGPPVWGALADRDHPDRLPKMLVTCSLIALGFAGLLLFDWSLWALFAVLFAMSFFLSGLIPVTESMTIKATGGDLGRYGRVRLWGSVGFIVAVLVSGWLFDRIGIEALPFGLLVVLALLVFAARGLQSAPVLAERPARLSYREILATPAVKGFLFASFLMLLAHAPLYTLFSLWLEQKGYSRTQIGLLWTLGVLAEILVFQFQRHFFAWFSVATIWRLSYAVTALRFALISISEGGLLILLLAQAMHAVTFGLHHSASVALVRQWFPQAAQARGQALYTMAAYGLGGSLGGIAAGSLWEAFVPEAAFWAAALAALAGLAVSGWVIRHAKH
ncbi:MAG: MFS transporter [Burkholderiaceae bacterium]|nr:MFS transporter [Burkholderiaceae bacterium]